MGVVEGVVATVIMLSYYGSQCTGIYGLFCTSLARFLQFIKDNSPKC